MSKKERMTKEEFGTSQKAKKYPRDSYMMQNKPPYAVSGCSEWVEKYGSHVIIDQKQMVRACKNPMVEGPKILLECVGSGKVPVNADTQKLAAEVRRLQKEVDDEKTAKEAAEKALKDAEGKNPPAPVQVETGNSAVDDVVKTLEAMESAADVKTYAKETLGMKSTDFPGNPSKGKVIEAVRDNLMAKAAKSE